MRAALYRDQESPIEIVDMDVDAPREGEVRVEITAAGVCHSELHLTRGDWYAPAPLIPGHEGSGVVAEVGPGVTELSEGDHVILSWNPYCGTCEACHDGRETQCSKVATVINTSGGLLDGTSRLSLNGERINHYIGVSSWAQEAIVPQTGAIKVRKDVNLANVALIGCAAATGVGAAIKTAKVHEGATVVVIGCGGIGLNVIQGARLNKASRIVAVDVSAERAESAKLYGATEAVAVTDGNTVEAVRDVLPNGADYVFDAIGLIKTTEAAIKLTALGGAAVIVGLPAVGEKASFEPLVLAEADARILGSNYGSIRPQIDIPFLVDKYVEGELLVDQMISARRPLDDAQAALDDLAAGRELRQLLLPNG